LLSACTRGKGSIELQPNREGKPTGLAANRTEWGGGGCATFREGEEELVMGVGAGFLGKGIELWRKTGGVSREVKGKREARRERNRSAVGLFALSLSVVFSMLGTVESSLHKNTNIRMEY